MERTVPTTASDEVSLYLRTIYSLLKTSSEFKISALEESHAAIESTLHAGVRSVSPDLSAFIYCLQRLPEVISKVSLVILGQSASVFNNAGIRGMDRWTPVTAPARRRRWFYDGGGKLAAYIASRSDLDDLIPSLVAYQIEWNKIHRLLEHLPKEFDWSKVERNPEMFTQLATTLELERTDLSRLVIIWGKQFAAKMQEIGSKQCKMSLRLLAGSLNDYRIATSSWWSNIRQHKPDVEGRPVYFVSSNTHSFVNLITGVSEEEVSELLKFIEKPANKALMNEYESIASGALNANIDNFWYYVGKKYQAEKKAKKPKIEKIAGLTRIRSEHSFDVEAQIFELNALDISRFDPRVKVDELNLLKKSKALILNIDYPLGMAAYNLLVKIAEHVQPIYGVYIMGKAATLNGRIGDVLIPDVVQDEHSLNTYLFNNCFKAADVAPYLQFGTVLDNQKSMTVYGTFLQNSKVMDVVYREGYTDIEMEAGPYLSAVYEMTRTIRHPVNEIVDSHNIAFDLGILHYASDKPLSRGQSLGAATMSYFGMDPTYACSVAILRRILSLETARMATVRG
ncbi:MAG TPA: hypothetical protein PKD55_10085 [Bellilinea sp.]|nr:hypothetical protein [Bellilinea sp.]